MELVILVVGVFLWYIAKTLEPASPQALALQKEIEDWERLQAQLNTFQIKLDQMCYDNCSICGKWVEFASKCEKSHLEDIEKAKRSEGLKAFKIQEKELANV